MFESVNGVSVGMTLKNTLQLKGGGQGVTELKFPVQGLRQD
jgi:hypothetical protein